jgi:hypothetical protein
MSNKPKHPKNYKAPADHQSSAKEHPKDCGVYIRNGVEIDLSENLRTQQHAEQIERTTHSDKQLFWARFTFWGLVAYTTITGLMYCANKKAAEAAKQSADTARDALVVSERAFVAFSGLGTPIPYFLSGTVAAGAYTIPIQWTNAGTTATKKGAVYVGHRVSPKPLPDNFDYPSDSPRQPFVIGPKGTAAWDYGVPAAELLAVQSEGKHIYFWGWNTYRDIFPQTPVRLTEFCVDVAYIMQPTVPGQPADAKRLGPTILPKYSSCPKHNCYDEECPDYKERTKEE